MLHLVADGARNNGTAKAGQTLVIGTTHSVGPIVEHLRRSDSARLGGVVILGEEPLDLNALAARLAVSVRSIALGLHSLERVLSAGSCGTAIIALPSSEEHARSRAEHLLTRHRVQFRAVPCLDDVLSDLARPHDSASPASRVGEPSAAAVTLQPRAITGDELAALIGRTPYRAHHAEVEAITRGKRVLVTGAGGSIGSELCRVACAFEPAEIILMERSENALFEIDRQIASRFPGVQRRAILHDVVDGDATRRLLEKHRPHAVFHAAAHKHVPLMEDHPAHAIVNNLFGTKSIADAAVECGAERFVLISSDKAVNPVSIMGATKRLAELYTRSLATQATSTRLSMVRFGNVLGSACSVLTIWAQQIADGQALSITDPRMTRYFMTIPEAATLVLQSATLRPGATDLRDGAGGVYVLDMGEPVRILDLAVRFCELSGLAPRIRVDTCDAVLRSEIGSALRLDTERRNSSARPIDIVFTGIRPGEKIHEELAYAAEMLRPTSHPGIRSWAGEHALGDIAAMLSDMGRIVDNHHRGSPDAKAAITATLRRHIPEMRPGPVAPDVAPLPLDTALAEADSRD